MSERDLDAYLDRLEQEDREAERDEEQRRLYEAAPKLGRDVDERIADALAARNEGAKCCTYRSFDYGNSCRCVLAEGHEGSHIV